MVENIKKLVAVFICIAAVFAMLAGVMAILGLYPRKYSKEYSFDI